MKLYTATSLFLEELKDQIKQKTYLHYQNLCEGYMTKYFNIDLDLVTHDDLRSGFREITERYSVSLTKALYSLVTRSLSFAYEKGYSKNRIAFKLRIKSKPQKQVECLTKQEQRVLEAYITEKKKPYYYGFLISLYTGLRLGELLALKWRDINFKHKILRVNATTSKCIENHKQIDIEDLPKTNSSIREIPLTDAMIKLLKALKAPSIYVLCNRNNEKIDYRGYQMSFTRLLKRLKIRHYGFHSLRHTFATRLLENGVDIKTISELMGHSTPTVTLNRYVHTNLENKRKAMQKITKKGDL